MKLSVCQPVKMTAMPLEPSPVLYLVEFVHFLTWCFNNTLFSSFSTHSSSSHQCYQSGSGKYELLWRGQILLEGRVNGAAAFLAAKCLLPHLVWPLLPALWLAVRYMERLDTAAAPAHVESHLATSSLATALAHKQELGWAENCFPLTCLSKNKRSLPVKPGLLEGLSFPLIHLRVKASSSNFQLGNTISCKVKRLGRIGGVALT